MQRLTSWLALRAWRFLRWRQRRRRARWLRRYVRAVAWHSTTDLLAARAMAQGRLIDAPHSLRACPTRCALRDLGHPEEDLL